MQNRPQDLLALAKVFGNSADTIRCERDRGSFHTERSHSVESIPYSIRGYPSHDAIHPENLAQSPAQVLSSFVPDTTSLYGAAPSVDSLLGNISTSAGLNALSQINATRSTATQISPFSDSSQAVTFGTDSENSAMSTLFSSSLGNSNDSLALPAAYYSQEYSTVSSPTLSQVNITA
ncbi:hypothetical protein OAG63_01385 [Methylacidiphilales bacterium]|nr:hypothetical protein [Candidatus Methylacidiphilales bacterium]